jgi:hypothetical protein
MRHDIEYALAETFKDYLTAKLDAADFVFWPIVTLYDPMAIDDANRVVCIVTDAELSEKQDGNFTAEIEIGVKTFWTQPDVATELAAHFDRVNQVRDVLSQSQEQFLTDLAAVAPAGMTITFANRRKKLSTAVNEANYYSTSTFTVHGFTT